MKILKKIYQYLIDIGIFAWIPDKKYIKHLYYKKFHKKLDLNNPTTFNEKLQYLKLYNRKSEYSNMVDKYESKKYVSKIIGEEYIIPTLGIWNKFEDIDFDKLPEQFVLKCTHDSGGVYICKDKEKINKRKLKIKFKLLLKRNFYYRFREYVYKDLKHRIIAEKYMGNNLNDYKIFCFNGEPKIILVCSNRSKNYKNTNFYDTNWNLMPFTRSNHKNNTEKIEKPKKLEEMLDIAKKLSKGIPFVRIDLYNINKKIYFGEMTFMPSGGFEGFEPEKWDVELGNMIDIG